MTKQIIIAEGEIAQRHIPDVEGRVGNVDNGIFIHAIVPRLVETVALLTRRDAK